MLKFGSFPFLECSSKGDKRFSAFYAKIRSRENKSIEEIYQSSKIFKTRHGNNFRYIEYWRDAKGLEPINKIEIRKLYSNLWDEYFEENSQLLDIIKEFNGFSDIFGQKGHCCQAEEIWRIKNEKENNV